MYIYLLDGKGGKLGNGTQRVALNIVPDA